ncbi:diguanylate cyclase [Photobacterium damselae subsp. damselae]|uniref:sensor domain-containing diguanylate cyclase n=1 Tax=Photobacterium damselae TaxID=38293 RepID=UPI00311B1909
MGRYLLLLTALVSLVLATMSFLLTDETMAEFATLIVVFCIVFGGVFVLLLIYSIDSLSLEKTHQILAKMPFPVALVRLKDGQLLYCNKACRELLSIRKIGDSYLYPEYISSATVCDFLQTFHGQNSFQQWSESVPMPGNKSLSLDITGKRIRYHWYPTWMLFISKTPQNNSSENQLAQEQLMFQSVLNSLSELVYFQDPQGRIMGSNKAFDRFWQGRIEEGVLDYQQDHEHSLGTNSIHWWTTNPEGSSRLLETNQTSLINAKGDVMGTLNISHDVTEWHEMQESLRTEIERREETEQTLAQQNNLLDTIINSSTDPIGLVNQYWVYIGCNELFAQSLGYTKETLLGKSAEEVISSDKWEMFRQSDREVMELGRSTKTEDCVLKNDGTLVWYEVQKSPFIDPTDGARGMLIIARDVTERKKAEQQLADAIMELQALSFIDGLTRIANRRSFDDSLHRMWHSHIRLQQPLTLIFCDIDYFKAFNDSYGHQIGDTVLREVATVLSSVIQRETDEVARYGGEEFAILLPTTDSKGGEYVAKKLQKALALRAKEAPFCDIPTTLTLSIGITTVIPQPNEGFQHFLEQADKALYQAKAAGRNCYRHFQ